MSSGKRVPIRLRVGTPGNPDALVEVDGHDLTRYTTGVRLRAHAAEFPELELDLMAEAFEIEGEARVVIERLRVPEEVPEADLALIFAALLPETDPVELLERWREWYDPDRWDSWGSALGFFLLGYTRPVSQGWEADS